MSRSVLIYSADAIRGMILLKTLQLKNIQAELCGNYSDIKAVLGKNSFDVLVFDCTGNFFNDLKYLKLLSRDIPDIHKILLVQAYLL